MEFNEMSIRKAENGYVILDGERFFIAKNMDELVSLLREEQL